MEHIVQDVYGDYSGRPYTLPWVEVIIDEARSRLSTLDRRFDIIQLSLIDTFSLNAAGGFVITEARSGAKPVCRDCSTGVPTGLRAASRYLTARQT
jgi:hypothetical protein